MAEVEHAAARAGRGVVVVPTYNEAENIAELLSRVRQLQPDFDVLVLDDNSPDGTGSIVDRIVAADPVIHVMHRAAKEGLGVAYVAGLQRALAMGYRTIVQMDADGSHQPDQIARLLTALEHADVVIGSRWVSGGSVQNWSWHRAALSRSGNLYIKLLLGLPIRDATAGFRAYRASALEALGISSINTRGYGFQTDVSRRAVACQLRVAEVPIDFADRTRGVSKMSVDIMAETLLRVTSWGVRDRISAVRRRARALRVRH